jgi:DNA-binding transcriptional MerR regulator
MVAEVSCYYIWCPVMKPTRLTVSDVASAAGLPTETVRTWSKRGLIDLGRRRKETGWTRYTPHDAVVLALVRALADHGVPLASAAEAAAGMEDRIWQADLAAWRADRPDYLLTFSAERTFEDVFTMLEPAPGGWTGDPVPPEREAPARTLIVLALAPIRASVLAHLSERAA